ncbi:hypothetical protein DL897_11275 [Thermoflavimicrobium daqui]|uniref:Uncharacterized protein n=1 Tax=Thermoflavimicrobium daqui TaxID=2137476 RepID=A0A364K4G3_9BACL|nr:hypothetical protein DL897_11275 [Thermoflavimicrobium daqui]
MAIPDSPDPRSVQLNYNWMLLNDLLISNTRSFIFSSSEKTLPWRNLLLRSIHKKVSTVFYYPKNGMFVMPIFQTPHYPFFHFLLNKPLLNQSIHFLLITKLKVFLKVLFIKMKR